MRCLGLLLFAPLVLGILQFRERGYLKLPYNTNGQFAMLRDGATKARYHQSTRMLYVIGQGAGKLLHIIELTNPDAPAIVYTHHFDGITDGQITDVQVCQDTIAVSLANNPYYENGHVELFQPYSKLDPKFTSLGRVTVGHYPKDMAFTPDCSRLVVVNEGRPGTFNGQLLDKEGSITIIVRNDQGFPPEVNANFDTFNDRASEYLSKGVRYVYRGDPMVDAEAHKFSFDLEPESVTVDSDGRYVYVSLQENNAIVKFDLTVNRFIDIYALGVKNWTNFDMDASDRDGGPNMFRYPIYSFYQPRDIKYGEINGQGYIVSANTGAMRDWRNGVEGFEFSDGKRARIVQRDNLLDEARIDANTLTQLRTDTQLGRLHMSIFDGYNFNNLIEYPHGFGGRSLSMWNTVTMQRVYDTGDDLEREALAKYGSTFNGDAVSLSVNSPSDERDLRSDDYGPEPTCLDLGTFNANPVVVTGTRSGMIYAYSLTGTAMTFQSVHRRGNITQTWNTLYTAGNAGDALITDIGYVDAANSPSNAPLVYVIASGTSSVSLYDVYDDGNTKK